MADPDRATTAAQDPQAELLQQIAELRGIVDSLRLGAAARRRITLRALQGRPYLGQSINLVAAVTTGTGEPAADAPMTLTTSWGRLRAVAGTAVTEAVSVAVRTAADGAARVLLVPPTPADLTPSQQSTLEDALHALDPAARGPDGAAAGLRLLAQQYRWDGHPELRQAIDIYFRELGRRQTRQLPQQVSLVGLPGETWAAVDATVLAFALGGAATGADAAGSSVLATAALPLRFNDWLAPWLQALLDVSGAESTLGQELAAGLPQGDAADVESLLGHVYGRVRDFVADQKGALGELVGRRIVESSLRQFIDTGLKDLPAATQVAVFPGLEIASSTVAAAGGSVLAAVGQTHRDLSRSIDRKIESVPKTDLTGITGRLDRLDATVAVKADSTVVEGLRTEVKATLAAKADRVDLGTLNDRLSKLDISVTHLGTDLASVGTTVAAKADRTAVDAVSASFTQQMTALSDRSVNLEQRVSTIDTSVAKINTTIKASPGGTFHPAG